MHIEDKGSIRKFGIVDTTMYRIEKEAGNTLMFEDQKWQGGRGGGGVERKKGGVRAKSSRSSSLTAGFNQSED